MSRLVDSLIEIASALNLDIRYLKNGETVITIPSNEYRVSKNSDFGTAVRAIMESGVDEYYKRESIKRIKKDQRAEYYEAIAAIACNAKDGYFMLLAIGDICDR